MDHLCPEVIRKDCGAKLKIVEFLQYLAGTGAFQQYLDNKIGYLEKYCTCQSAIWICLGSQHYASLLPTFYGINTLICLKTEGRGWGAWVA